MALAVRLHLEGLVVVEVQGGATDPTFEALLMPRGIEALNALTVVNGLLTSAIRNVALQSTKSMTELDKERDNEGERWMGTCRESERGRKGKSDISWIKR